MTAASLSADRRRLLYRATHRGFKEADLLVGEFAKAHLATMDEAALAAFAQLLEVPDQSLYAWITGREAAPAAYRGPVLEKMQAFDVAPLLRG